MSRPRVSELTVTGAAWGPGKRPRVAGLMVTGVPDSRNKRPRITRLTLSGSRQNYRPRIFELTVSGVIYTMTTAKAGDDQTVEPGSIVTVDAVASTGDNPTYLWEITSGGTDIELTGSGSARRFTAPYSPTTRVVTLRVTVTAGDKSAQDELTVTIRPHQMWHLNAAGQFVPVTYPFVRVR